MPNEPDHLTRWAKDVSKLLQAYRQLSATTSDHNTTRGTAREFFVANVLKSFLPQTFRVGTGQALDREGDTSRQLDVIVYRPDFPLLSSLAGGGFYFVEGVASVLEVKSDLTGSKLKESLENIHSVRRLYQDTSAMDLFDLGRKSASAYVFGYSGSRLETLKSSLIDWICQNKVDHILELPDVIATDKVAIVKNDRSLLQDQRAIREQFGFDPVYLAADVRGPQSPLLFVLQHLLWRLGDQASGFRPNPFTQFLLRRSVESRTAFTMSAKPWGKLDHDCDRGRILEFIDC